MINIFYSSLIFLLLLLHVYFNGFVSLFDTEDYIISGSFMQFYCNGSHTISQFPVQLCILGFRRVKNGAITGIWEAKPHKFGDRSSNAWRQTYSEGSIYWFLSLLPSVSTSSLSTVQLSSIRESGNQPGAYRFQLVRYVRAARASSTWIWKWSAILQQVAIFWIDGKNSNRLGWEYKHWDPQQLFWGLSTWNDWLSWSSSKFIWVVNCWWLELLIPICGEINPTQFELTTYFCAVVCRSILLARNGVLLQMPLFFYYF